MTRSVIYFHFDEPGQRAKFVDTFKRIQVLETSSFQDGYLGGQLLATVDDERLAVVIADWESPESYQGWLDNPVRETIGEQLSPLWTSESEGQVFEVLHNVRPRTSVQS